MIERGDKMNKYLNFRLRFISGYGFQIEDEKMIDLVEVCPSLWIEIKGQIEVFFKHLNI